MGRMAWRLTVILAMMGVAALGMAPRAQAESFAGHWRLDFYGKCVNSVANRQACAALQTPATFPIMGVPGTVLIVRGIGEYTSDAAGHYTVHFVTTITERAPHAGAPQRCDNATVFGTIYTGTCREVGSGHGHIAHGGTGMPDFWQDDAAGAWNGRPPARFIESSTVDTMNPACAGTFDTKKFMGFLGYKRVPAGITARVVLTHS